AFSWRATFWFLAIFVGACFVLFVPFRDTYRRERSLVYQLALRRRVAQRSAQASELSSQAEWVPGDADAAGRKTDAENSPRHAVSEDRRETDTGNADIEKQEKQISQVRTSEAAPQASAPLAQVELSLADVNPVKPVVHVLRRLNNIAMFLASALVFACTYSITYTCSRTLAAEYGYDALQTGLVLLAFGSARYPAASWAAATPTSFSADSKSATAARRAPSTLVPMTLLPPSVLAYGWREPAAALCATLFLIGFFSMCCCCAQLVHSCTLAYIVDANTGRASSALAANSTVRASAARRGRGAPLQDALGDGG
ncbi:hypothetical protein C2E23DRAFT_891342, partial [Lenzites betulinus]